MFEITKFSPPYLLRQIHDPPTTLRIRGTYPPSTYKFVAVVGSRRYTPYGKAACEKVIHELRGMPVVIVSGLALGIDGIAHKAALDAGLHTVAVPGSGLDERVLYPATHRKLARDILKAGGALVSEFAPMWKPRPESFPQRNRIMAGLSHAVLVVEATLRSGTLITARLAAEYNRDVMAIAGPIQSPTSKGPHMLIKRGAALVESGSDVLEVLDLHNDQQETAISTSDLSEKEIHVFNLLEQPLTRDEVREELQCDIVELNTLFASLELKGVIREHLGKMHRA